MTDLTCFTGFAGGGLKTLGAMAAGFRPVGAVEWNPDPKIGSESCIAEAYRANVGGEVICKPVQEVDYRPFAGVDLALFSPVCKNFSTAKAGRAEGEAETGSAGAVCRAIREMGPRLAWGAASRRSRRAA